MNCFLDSTGCEAHSEIQVCPNGWIDFSCKYPSTENTTHRSVSVVIPNQKETLQSRRNDAWEIFRERFFLYHDTKTKSLRMIIKQLERDDFGGYECKFDPGPSSTFNKVELELKPGKKCLNTNNSV